jgi:hypothetical protein
MDIINDDDILIYIDAGCYINPAGVKRFNEYIEMLNNSDEGCISFQISHYKEKAWTTKEIFEHFNINNDSDDILETGQIMATIKMFKKNANAVNIVSTWLNALYRNPIVFTDHYNKNNQSEGFIDNRHDQSVCSIICKLYKTIVIEDETYFENGFGDEVSLKYPLWATKIRI